MAGLPPSTVVWVWYLRDIDRLIDQMSRIAGQKGVVIKGADGRHVWNQWTADAYQRFARVGIQCGLWCFQYGRGLATYDGSTERPGVAAELAALDRCIATQAPDFFIANIEEQVMMSPNPATDVRGLISGATQRLGTVGLSCVWHWAESMGWPFHAAVEGGVGYFSNQVYGRDWKSYGDYRRLHDAHGGGKPDYISLSANTTPQAMYEDGAWAIGQRAPGVAWWEAASLSPGKWGAVNEVAGAMAARTIEAGDITFPDRPYRVQGGFAAFWRSLGDRALAVIGYPESDEFTATVDGVERTVQRFERTVLGWYPESQPDGVPAGHPFHIRVLTRKEQDAIAA